MKQARNVAGCVTKVLWVLCAIAWLTGCGSSKPEVVWPPVTGQQTSTNLVASGGCSGAFEIDDLVTLTFSGIDPPLPQHEERIKGDGTITPPFVGPVVAAGKTPGQLQRELIEKYKKYYQHPNVTVKDNRVYYITGEVNHPGPVAYIGGTDIVQAIAAAAGFTEYADKKNVQITRAGTRRRETVNYNKASDDPHKSVTICPNDTINVPRSMF